MGEEPAETLPFAITREELIREKQTDSFYTSVRCLEKAEEIAFEDNPDKGDLEPIFSDRRAAVVPVSL